MSVVQRVAGLAQGAKEIACQKDHAKQQHAFIKPAGHSSPKARGFGFGVHGLGLETTGIVGP